MRVYPNGDVLYSIRVTFASESQLKDKYDKDNDKDKTVINSKDKAVMCKDKDKPIMCSKSFMLRMYGCKG